MSEHIVLKNSPKIEFQLFDNGFQLIDEQTEQNSGFYSYENLQSIEVNKAWFPKTAKFLRVFTWMLNGVPLFPDAESCKKANVILQLKQTRFGMWLTDSQMARKAKLLKKALDRKINGDNAH